MVRGTRSMLIKQAISQDNLLRLFLKLSGVYKKNILRFCLGLTIVERYMLA